MNKAQLLLGLMLITSYCFSQNANNEALAYFGGGSIDDAAIKLSGYPKHELITDESWIVDWRIMLPKNFSGEVEKWENENKVEVRTLEAGKAYHVKVSNMDTTKFDGIYDITSLVCDTFYQEVLKNPEIGYTLEPETFYYYETVPRGIN